MHMEKSWYFENIVQPNKPEARREDWVQSVRDNPIEQDTDNQPDGRIAIWGEITETGQYMRVILLSDGETVHNAFVDRNFRRRIENK